MKKRRLTPLEIIRPRRGRMPCLWQGSPTGLTLIEILVVLFIMGFIATSLYYVLNAGIKGWRTGKERTDTIAQARVAMDRLTREAREATYMAAANTASINFSAELGTGSNRNVVYSYYGSTLYREEQSGEEKVMAKYITDFDFTYYSKGDDGYFHSFTPDATQCNSIWMIAIDAQVTRGATGEENVINLRSTVQPRNYSEYFYGH